MIDPRIEAYADSLTTPPADEVVRLDRAARQELPYAAMLSGAVVGRLLETLVWLERPRLVLELGTYAGTSALAMAAGLPEGGRIVTCELVDEHAEFAQRAFDASPLGERIELRRGPALDSVAAIDEPIDFCFIDADKPGYVDYYEAVLPKLSEHGLIAADNTLRGGSVLDPDDEGGRTMDAFNRHVAADPRTVQVLLTVRDGVTLIRRA
jgi:caffeoyl-CoA O-methyltransferase